MTRVTIYGPNLNDQSKGTFHVHAEGCIHGYQYGPARKLGGEDNGWTIETGSAVAVVEEVYADQLAESPGTEPHEWLDDFYFAPCLRDLPTVEIERTRPTTLFEVGTSTLFYSNDARLHVVHDGDEFAVILLPAETTAVAIDQGNEVFRTKLRVLADAYIAGYDLGRDES